MLCPKCQTRLEVLETRTPYRRRRCTNPQCNENFITEETIIDTTKVVLPAHRCLRTRTARRIGPHTYAG
jgi:transcriptional regulator NrdR family protein